MKNTIKKELHTRSRGELEKQLLETKKALAMLSLDHKMGKVKNTSDLRNKRAEIVVIKTIINEKKVLERDVKEEKKEVSVKKTVPAKNKSVKKAEKKEVVNE